MSDAPSTVANATTPAMPSTNVPASIPSIQQIYAQERAKRLRPEGSTQFIDVSNSPRYRHFQTDPWADHRALNALEPALRDGARIPYLVIGGGYGGLVYAAKLIDAGVSATEIRIVDSAGGFGGTWYWNRYPGLMCDVESYMYMPLLEEMGYMPRHKYAYGEELRGHAERIAERWGVDDKALFRVDVKDLSWEEEGREWRVEMSENRGAEEGKRELTVHARVVFWACGVLHYPQIPKLLGFDSFKPRVFHSSRWDYSCTGGSPTDPRLEGLKGKIVGIIGTGATGVQIVPELAKWAKHLYVFQRTPSAVERRDQRATTPKEWKKITSAKKYEFGRRWMDALPSYRAVVGGPTDGIITPADVPAFLSRLHAEDLERCGSAGGTEEIAVQWRPPPRQQPSRLRVSSDPGSPPSLSSSPLSPPPSSPRLFTIATTSFSTPAPPVLPTRDANDDDSVDDDFITPPQRSAPRAPPPILPKSAARHPAIGTQAPLPIPKPKLTPASIPLPSSPPRRFMADSFVQFTGDRRIPNEPAAADVVKRLCAEFAHNPGMTDAEKIEIAGTRFRWNSPADRWYEELIARNPKPKEATVWTAFASAFKARFKGTSAVVKPRGQLEAELSGMRITMAELSKGTIIVGSAEVHVLVDFVERVREAIAESEAGRKDVGLWGFYTALPLFLKDAVGGLLPPTWEDMANMLSNVPQGKVDLATEQYRAQTEAADGIKGIERTLERLQVSAKNATRSAASTSTTATPPSRTSAPAAANNGAKATAAQKEGLERVLRSCVSRMHPDTAQGRAAHRADLATWQKKFGKLTRDELELEVRGFPLTPGTDLPCTDACFRCGFTTPAPHAKTEGGCAPHPELPAHERSLRALGQTWLGKVDLRTVAPVNVVAAGPWYDDEQTENAGEAGFAEGLQQ
ncbi:hypothetical protein C8R43DRAFT_1145790 [Mycena crocata]|nr:hypothetical protein C8R43DRAFT_1145790 [Mycena crocata]